MQKDTCKSNQIRRKAFTLIELLIVIAIIGILFIVLISKVDFATDKAKATGVQTDFRSFQMAFDTVAKENAGFNTFGWDTGDANQDGIRNSYDEGDNNKDGIQNGTEVFTGHKVYAETFTKVYSLKKNGTGSYDRDALNRLETAINANLDPKLHITIKDDGEIVMANGAQDPWDKEYHGWYITNAETDKKDRGAIVMYSDGANNEFGSEHTIANGIVTVNVPGNNKLGKDDYSIAVIYTYVNGYGEVQTSTSGFSNNQTTQGNISNNSGTEGTEGTEDPDVTELLEPGLYNSGAIELAKAGDVEAAQDMIKTSWNDLLTAGIVHVTTNGVVYSNSAGEVDGDLVLPNDGSITSVGDTFYYDDDGDDTGDIGFSSCSKLTGIAIPNSVTKIGDEAFWGCVNLKTITFTENSLLGEIGISAFAECIRLTSIAIPDSVTSIDYYAFFYCPSLISLEIPDSVTYIGGGALDECSNLQYNEYNNAWYFGNNNNPYLILVFADMQMTSIDIHSNTKIIYSYAFRDCYNLTSVTIPDSVTCIGAEAFKYCGELTSVNIPNGVTSIGDQTFYGCNNITSVTIPDSVTSIGYEAFCGCTGLTSIVIPDSVTSIDGWAFVNCNSLSSVVISDSVTSIGDSVFHNCNSLTNIVIPDSVTSIDRAAFSSCKALTSVTIPDSVTSIGTGAFASCTSLTNITFNGSVEQWSSISKQSNWNNLVPATYVQCTDGQVAL